MQTWTRLPRRPLEHWRGLSPRRRRELRLTAADWLFALGPLPLALQFQLQSLDGWGLVGGSVGVLFEELADVYGSPLAGLLYFFLPVACAAAATLVRRRHPLWLMVLGLLLLVGFANLVPAVVAVYSYAVHSEHRRLVAVWGAAGTAATWTAFVGIGVDVAVMATMLMVSVLVLGLYVGTRRQLVDRLQERAERLERERHLLAEQAVGAERTRIAREMHDVVAHRVSLIVLHAGGLEVSTTDPRAVEAAELIRTTGRTALGELRDILGVLREHTATPPPTRPQPTLEDVRELVAEWREAGMRIDLLGDVPEGVPPAAQRTGFHVVKEGVTNAAKHAAGARVSVETRHEDGVLTVEVANGPSPDLAVPAPTSGFGLAGLRERVAAAGGDLDARAGPDGGWRLTVALPARE